MCKTKRYTLKFKKKYNFVDYGVWDEVTDACLMLQLRIVQRLYGFEIISTKFHDSDDDEFSYIKIKCNKKDYPYIWQCYCERVDEHITDISF